MTFRDTADLAWVTHDKRSVVDGGEGSDATGDGGAEWDFADLYDEPGEVVDLDAHPLG